MGVEPQRQGTPRDQYLHCRLGGVGDAVAIRFSLLVVHCLGNDVPITIDVELVSAAAPAPAK